MKKTFASTISAYVKNLAIHGQRIVRRTETPGEALSRVRKDTKKLVHVAKGTTQVSRKHAAQLVEQGRRIYNARNYEGAEEVFRQAVAAGPDYGLAHTYLGHALYRQGRYKEAIASWKRAIEVDPGSEAAKKAEAKIGHVEQSKEQVVQQLTDNLRDSRRG